MSSFKKVLLSCCMVAGLGVTQSAHAFSLPFSVPGTDTIVNGLIDTVAKYGAAKACAKGSTVKPLTIRSFDGVVGKVKPLAAVGMLLCDNSGVDGFKESKFRTNAVKTLGTEDLAAIRTGLLADIKKASGPVKTFACKIMTSGALDKGGVPVSTLAASACAAPAA
ncbi:MAG: hypothetical protein H2057_02455 [Alphaproteobacteria bacterium]|nr:hypothetical protein [Alphaproteobacteria bacterium]